MYNEQNNSGKQPTLEIQLRVGKIFQRLKLTGIYQVK